MARQVVAEGVPHDRSIATIPIAELSVAVTESSAWARLWPATRPEFNPQLRHGAWYRVLSRGETLAVLEVRGQRMSVRSELLEMRAKRPDRFTVVYRAPGDETPVSGQRDDPGRVYAVCPHSASRLRLRGHPDELDCPQCGHHGVIAWWETG